VLDQLQNLLEKSLAGTQSQTFTAEQIHRAFIGARKNLLPSYLAQDAVVYLLQYPLMSMNASGKWQNEIVYITRSGKTYIRRYVKPRNPQTVPQQTNRNYFKILVAHYQQESAEIKSFWKEKAKSIIGKSGYNLYLGEMMKLLQQGIEPPIGFRG
jgi:hypothetical protein